MSAPTLDRTWTEDEAGLHVETHVEDFTVDVVRCGGKEVVTIRGELDLATAPLLRAVLDTVHARRPRRVEVDLSGVSYLDASAMTTLVAARRRLGARGTTLALHRPSPITRRVLELTGFDRVFEITGAGPAAHRRAS